MKKLLLFLLAFAITGGLAWGQTTIAFQGFEGSGSDTWNIATGLGNIATNTGSADYPANARIRTGTKSWQVTNATATLELNSATVSGYGSVKIIVHLSSTSVTSGNGADASDFIKAFANVDGAGYPATADIEMDGNNNARWDYNATLTQTTAAGTSVTVSAPQGGTNSNNYATLEITIPDGSTNVAFKLIANNNSTNEYWNIDDVELTGTSSTGVDNPVSFLATTAASSEIDLSWTRNSNLDSVMVVWSPDDNFGTPVDGTYYLPGQAIPGGDSVIFRGIDTTFAHTGLTPATHYYYKAFSVDGSAAYSAGVTDDATTSNSDSLILSTLCDPKNDYRTNRYIQIFNAGTSIVDLSTWKVVAVANGSDIYTWNLSGTIKPGGVSTCGDDGNTDFTPDFAPVDWSTSNGDWNGGDTDGAKLLNGSTIVDDASSFSIGFSDKVAYRNANISSPNTIFTAAEWTTRNVDSTFEKPSTPTHHDCDLPLFSLPTGNWSTLTSSYGNSANYTVDGTVTVDNTIPGYGECNNLTVNPGYSLTIPVGNALTVYSDLTNSAATSNVLVESNSSGNGSLIVEGTSIGDVTIQRYFAGYTSSSDGWHEIGVPVQSMTVTGSDFEPGTASPHNDDLYYWSESNNLWMNWKTTSFNFNTVGQGYLVSYESDQTNSFTGTLQTVGYSFMNLTRDNAKGNGWHLFGNAYSSALEWNNCSGWMFLHIGNIASVWDENSGTYSTIGAGDIIPSTTGFFLQIEDGYDHNNELTIRTCGRVHNSHNNYKSGSAKNPKYTLDMKVTTTVNSFSNTTRVAFNPNATQQWDMKYDSHKLYGNEAAPELWTLSNNEAFALNTLPFSQAPVDLPLNFKAGADGSYTITFDGINSFENSSSITLEDLFTGQTVDMMKNTSYTYTASKGDDFNRFVLHFYGVNSTPEIETTNNEVLIYAYNNSVILKSLNSNLEGTVEIINILGQTMDVKKVSHSNFFKISTTLDHGIYFIRYRESNGFVQTSKVVLD